MVYDIIIIMKSDIVLTVGITAHAEGVLAHKTMRAVFVGLENLDKKNILMK